MNGLRFSTQQVLTAASSSAASDAFGANTEYIRVVSTIATYIQIAVSPTATTSKTFLPAKEIEIWKVSPGEKVAAILATGTGAIYISQLSE